MKYALFVIQLIPAIIDIIRKVEELYPEAGAGKDKLLLVKSMLQAAHDNITEAWPQIEKIVGVVVEFANRFGVFKKADA
jgi:hypothetical protein